MKLKNKTICMLGAAALAGLLFSVGGQAGSLQPGPETDNGYQEPLVFSHGPAGVMFSHKAHVEGAGLECDDCHPKIFKMENGSTEAKGDVNMASLDKGKYCGACHNGDVAFSTKNPEYCVTCHGSPMQKPKTIVFTEPVKAVLFDHKMHTEEMGFECSACHPKLFRMKVGDAESQPDKFVMKALYAGKYCGACHNGDNAFASDTKCTTCHIGVLGYDRLFSGKKGAKKKEEHSEH
ncbi:MAG TPA: hypothetical protein ENK27_03795 [Desulfobulbus sp.]|nr:hypothetical protein [Desulfobulbus sp.]